MMSGKAIKGGVYLVVDPAMKEANLLDKLAQILPQEPAAIQIWDHFSPETDKEKLCKKITEICMKYEVPVLINNRWELAIKTGASGVHFDEIPSDFELIKQALRPDKLIGLTLNNELDILKNAGEIDYISFCSIFNSPTSNSCELVDFETVKQARKDYKIPIFLSGGITPENIPDLKNLDFDGVAVVSGIMSSETPGKQMKIYKNILENEK